VGQVNDPETTKKLEEENAEEKIREPQLLVIDNDEDAGARAKKVAQLERLRRRKFEQAKKLKEDQQRARAELKQKQLEKAEREEEAHSYADIHNRHSENHTIKSERQSVRDSNQSIASTISVASSRVISHPRRELNSGRSSQGQGFPSVSMTNYEERKSQASIATSESDDTTTIAPSSVRPIKHKGYNKKASNKLQIKNAIGKVCLAGMPNTREREEVLKRLDEDDHLHYIILFKGSNTRFDFRALYSYEPSLNSTEKIISVGNAPATLNEDQVQTFFRYNTGAREFRPLSTKSFSIAIDAVRLKSSGTRAAPRGLY